MAKGRRRVIYEFEENGRRHWVEFAPLPKSAAPLFTHRVVIDGAAKDWLSDTHRANLKTARFFYEKHRPVTLAPAFRIHARVNFANGRTGTTTCDSFIEVGRFIDGQVADRFDGDAGVVLGIELTMVPIDAALAAAGKGA